MEREYSQLLSFWKAVSHSSIHGKAVFTVFVSSSIKGVANITKSVMNLLYQPISPRNDLTSFLVVGLGLCWIASTLLTYGLICPLPRMYPRYDVSFCAHQHFLMFKVNPALCILPSVSSRCRRWSIKVSLYMITSSR